MSKRITFGCVTCGTSLGSCTICCSPAMSKRITFGCVTYGASLGSCAVCCGPSMTGCGDNFFTFSVITTCAILMCGVTVFGTGCCFFCYVFEIVVESCLFNVSRVLTTRAGYVCIPALFSTGGSFCFVSNFCVIESVNRGPSIHY